MPKNKPLPDGESIEECLEHNDHLAEAIQGTNNYVSEGLFPVIPDRGQRPHSITAQAELLFSAYCIAEEGGFGGHWASWDSWNSWNSWNSISLPPTKE